MACELCALPLAFASIQPKRHRASNQSNTLYISSGLITKRLLIDDKDRLSESNRVSTLKNDSVKTVYNYDDQNRLIKTASDSTTVEFTYGNDNRELSSKKVQKFFTTETTITTCNEWNEFGRCTNARQNISILIKDDKDGKDHIYNHLANIKYDYVY